MKNIFLGFICLLAASMVAKANETLPQGTWEVENITVDNNTDGKIENKAYGRNTKIHSYLPCPQKWEIKDSKTIVLYFEEGQKETTDYELKDNQLIIRYAGAVQSYRYTVKDETLTLTITHKYKWNGSDGRVQNREEKWNITLKKQKP
jgi:hypothetical protein